LTEGGRAWPRAEAYDGALRIDGYSVEGFKAGATELRLPALFPHLPVAVLKARVKRA
jgi:(1->4)-alpha-D-glucan 1-alpha-D-glucosylmutase